MAPTIEKFTDSALGNVELISFPDYGAALDYSRPMPTHSISGIGSHSPDRDGHFSETRTYEEADRLATEGWPEGRERAEKLRAQISGIVGSRQMRPKLSRSVAGFSPCVPAAIAGDPDSMFTIRKTETQGYGKIVHIVYNNCVSGGLAASTLISRGALVLALVDTLEACGFRCQVTIACSTVLADGRTKNCQLIGVKEADQALNIDALAFWLAHPSSFRRVMFSIWDHAWGGRLSYGYGGIQPIAERLQGDIYLSEAVLGHVTDATAPQFLRRQLASYGVEFES